MLAVFLQKQKQNSDQNMGASDTRRDIWVPNEHYDPSILNLEVQNQKDFPSYLQTGVLLRYVSAYQLKKKKAWRESTKS